MTVSAVVITKNEEKNIPRLFRGLTWADEIVVVDDGSEDRTVEEARLRGAKVFVNPQKDFASQRNFGLQHASGDWILSLDADEEIPETSARLMRESVEKAGPETGGFWILRRNIVLGRWLRFGQQYGKRVEFYDFVRMRRDGRRWGDYVGGSVKLFRRQGAEFRNEVHEEPVVRGKLVQLQAYVNHYTGESIHAIFDKINQYTTAHARMEFERQGRAISFGRDVLWRPWKTFFRIYFRKMGMLDGLPGLIRCLADVQYEFLKNIKHYELCQQQKNGAIRK